MDICEVCGKHRSEDEQNNDRYITLNMDRKGNLDLNGIYSWDLCKKCGDILSQYVHQKIEEMEEA